MKNSLLTLYLVLSIGFSYAQNVYTEKMTTALNNFNAVENTTDYQNVAAEFEMISNVETEKWLPLYYHAHCYIMMSFSDRAASPEQKDSYLAQAEVPLNKMLEIAPNEDEAHALQALFYTAKLVIDPMNRAAKYSPLSQAAIEKSLALAPNNPRAQQLDLSNKVGTAQFFGKDITPYCAEAQELLDNWNTYLVRSELHPVWGKDQVEAILKNCAPTEAKTTETTQVTSEPEGFTLRLEIRKLKSDDGYIMLELLNEKEEIIQQTMGVVKDKVALIELHAIPQGTYAIRYFHDANENKKMDSNKYGIPQESYGFSNNARGFMGPPKYKKLLFDVNEDLNLKLNAKG